MLGMAKPQRPPKGNGTDEPKKPQRSGVALNSYIDEDVRFQLDEFLRDYNSKNEHPASLRSSIEAALKMYLKDKGFWPPPKKPDDAK